MKKENNKEHEARACLAAIRATRWTPTQARRIARDLRALADHLEATADAEERVGHRLRQAQAEVAPPPPRNPRAGPGLPPSPLVRWEPHRDRPGGRLYVGKALWYALGRPARLNVQRQGATLLLTPAGPGEGWATNTPPKGQPRLSIGEEAATALRLAEGVWPGRVVSGGIVIDMPPE
jgi:hypothetical protein